MSKRHDPIAAQELAATPYGPEEHERERRALLVRLLKKIRSALREEADVQPGGTLTYGRPHSHPRLSHIRRYTRAGASTGIVIEVRPDCPRPLAGRCECPPDGSLRWVQGHMPADIIGREAQYRNGQWRTNHYERADDGLWHCIRPMSRAMDRLWDMSNARYLVLRKLLDGSSLTEAWALLPDDPLGLAIRICETILLWRDSELAPRERRPRLLTTNGATWVEKSQAQRDAEEAV